ncbi:hypothetical protein FGO68_gene8092 [Halteria grandinella]|uniref:Uncharacterized protein n=1 Tax=Halteria grandinella TaxID=5974 RepID=A0A8J8N9W4_HALGN|nr:hypothetical protein FGO68_gene8092 [Halteria grandinella]
MRLTTPILLLTSIIKGAIHLQIITTLITTSIRQQQLRQTKTGYCLYRLALVGLLIMDLNWAGQISIPKPQALVLKIKQAAQLLGPCVKRSKEPFNWRRERKMSYLFLQFNQLTRAISKCPSGGRQCRAMWFRETFIIDTSYKKSQVKVHMERYTWGS